MKVDSKQLTKAGAAKYSAEASSLGFKPGFFPEQLSTDLGNGRPFVATRLEMNGEEFAGVLYTQDLGTLQLVVFND